MQRSSTPHRVAFTLIELLVVIIIISIGAGMTMPVISALSRDSRRASSINTIGVAVAAARAYSTREIHFAADLDPVMAGDQPSPDGYSGAAVIFTPQHEIRLVENSQFAQNGSGNALELDRNNGYSDLSGVDYLKLPRGYGVVGIVRNPTFGLLLLTPPFAIRFDEYGHLISARPSSLGRIVMYDGDYNGRYVTSKDRDSLDGYNSAEFDPQSSEYKESKGGIDPDSKKHKLGFDVIDTVIGVIVYSKAQRVQDGINLTTGDVGVMPPSNRDWLLENGQPIYFSRTTGTIIREGF